MTSAEKNAVSHRARALSAMRAQLERFINDAESDDA
jgi:inosine/xanthosine triphosphate pyrophosphatase family protein